MNPATRKRILAALKRHGTGTVATLRRDGYRPATTVECVKDNLALVG